MDSCLPEDCIPDDCEGVRSAECTRPFSRQVTTSLQQLASQSSVVNDAQRDQLQQFAQRAASTVDDDDVITQSSTVTPENTPRTTQNTVQYTLRAFYNARKYIAKYLHSHICLTEVCKLPRTP